MRLSIIECRRVAPLMLLLAAAIASAAVLRQSPADLVILNGKIVTLDPASRIVDAVAIRDGRFVAVGEAAQVRPLIGNRTRTIDAQGRTVIPGLIDTHVHALGVAATEARQPFEDLRSVDEMQAWIRRQAARSPDGTWIWTPRVFPTRIKERRFPTRAELDAAAPRHPVAVDGA